MEHVYEALDRRFRSSKRLRTIGRRLYYGHGGERVKSVVNHVEVTCTGIDNSMDTFDTEEPVYTLEFTIWSKHTLPKPAVEVMTELRRLFHNADLTSDTFSCVSMRLTEQQGPVLQDGTYRGSQTYELHTSNTVHVPAEIRRIG